MRGLGIIAVVVTVAGCGLFGPPSWVNTYPVDDDYVYGIGSAGVTYDRSRSRSEEIAVQRALDSLVKQIRVRVTSATVLSDVQSWSDYRSDTIQFSDEDLEGVEIVEVWIDSYGRAGKADQTYVLIRISKENASRIAAREPPSR